jgi:hypothetical protein
MAARAVHVRAIRTAAAGRPEAASDGMVMRKVIKTGGVTPDGRRGMLLVPNPRLTGVERGNQCTSARARGGRIRPHAGQLGMQVEL